MLTAAQFFIRLGVASPLSSKFCLAWEAQAGVKCRLIDNV